MSVDELDVLLAMFDDRYTAVATVVSSMTPEQWRRLQAQGVSSTWTLVNKLQHPRPQTRAETRRVLANILST